jgi:hypothetical protein
MAVGDLTAEQQAIRALQHAQVALLQRYLPDEDRAAALMEIREAFKRIEEAKGA